MTTREIFVKIFKQIVAGYVPCEYQSTELMNASDSMFLCLRFSPLPIKDCVFSDQQKNLHFILHCVSAIEETISLSIDHCGERVFKAKFRYCIDCATSVVSIEKLETQN